MIQPNAHEQLKSKDGLFSPHFVVCTGVYIYTAEYIYVYILQMYILNLRPL